MTSCRYCAQQIHEDDRSPSGWLHTGMFTAACNASPRSRVATPAREESA